MNTSVNIVGVEFKNLVMKALGTFGSGMEYSEFVGLSRLGATVTKGVASVAQPDNPVPRVTETYGDMINTVSPQSPGIEAFTKRDIPLLKQYDTRITVSVRGRTIEDYVEVVERLDDEPMGIPEINISYLNVEKGGIAFGQDPKAVEAIIREIKAHAKRPIIMKLSPNVTDTIVVAKAAGAGGTGVVSLTNTLTDMKIDIHGRAFALANRTGGFSGPATKPVAVRVVYQVAQVMKVPTIRMGGIRNGDDALEFILVGASVVVIGVADPHNLYATVETVKGIRAYMKWYEIEDINQLIGAVR